MILGEVSYLDCIVFLIFLAPQLLLQVGIIGTIICGLQALPFLALKLPYQFLFERYFVRKPGRSPFVQQATVFQDVVIRCVRYAFADIPASIGRVFFSKWAAVPFLRFRMLRHGYIRSPIKWQEIEKNDFKGVWITADAERKPDVILLYCHGGGFSMGSSYFYLEFLLAWATMLKEKGFKNPAIFALEYTLVPDAVYPTQFHQTVAAYKYLASIASEPSRLCVGGDSAGGTLILSLLLHLGSQNGRNKLPKPGYACLISPWTTLVSPKNRNTRSDYLNAESLRQYGRQYAGAHSNLHEPLVSPGTCRDGDWWSRAMPSNGALFIYGSEEVFATDIKELTELLQSKHTTGRVDVVVEKGGIHAWPVVALFLGDEIQQRRKGLDRMAKGMWENCGIRKELF